MMILLENRPHPIHDILTRVTGLLYRNIIIIYGSLICSWDELNHQFRFRKLITMSEPISPAARIFVIAQLHYLYYY